MGEFKLPSLDEITNGVDKEQNSAPKTTNMEEMDTLDFNYEQDLIELNDDDFTQDYDDNYYEEDNSLSEVNDFEEITGRVLQAKANSKTNNTVVSIINDQGDKIYLQEDRITDFNEGEKVTAIVDSESLTYTKTGLPVYVAASINLVMSDTDQEGGDSSQDNGNKFSIKDKFNDILGKLKNDLRDNPTENDPEDNDEEYPPEEKEDELNKNNEKPKRKKKENKIIKFYLFIANLIYSAITWVVEMLSKVPLIGRIFGLLKVLYPIFKIISKLWLLILILLIILMNSIFHQNSPDIPKDSEVIKSGEVSLAISNAEYKNGEVNLKVKNLSSVYADFYLTLEIKEKKFIPFLGEKQICTGDFTVLNLDEEKEQSISCKDKPNKAKINNIDINLDN